MGLVGTRQEGSLVQGFAPDPASAAEYTVGTSDPIDVTGRTAIRWNSQDGATSVQRLLNENTEGMTGLAGVDVLRPEVTAVAFAGDAGTVVEYELM